MVYQVSLESSHQDVWNADRFDTCNTPKCGNIEHGKSVPGGTINTAVVVVYRRYLLLLQYIGTLVQIVVVHILYEVHIINSSLEAGPYSLVDTFQYQTVLRDALEMEHRVPGQTRQYAS